MKKIFRSLLIVLTLALFLIPTFFSGFLSCGSSDDVSDPQAFEQSKAMAKTAMIIGFAYTGVLTPTMIKFMDLGGCQSGSMTVNPDGSITFYNCSPFPGLELDGTIKEEMDEDGNIDSEFDNFGGNYMGNEFRINGFIDQRNGPNGSSDFTFDLNMTATDEDGTTNWDVDAEFNIDTDMKLNGQMNINSDNFNTECNFNNTDLLNLIQSDSLDKYDDNCREKESTVPFV